jgi:hypothetical protein
MAIAESAAVASIIGKLLSMSTDLLDRKESKEVMTEVRAIQKLTIELHSLYTMIETKHHEIESELQTKLFNSQSQITQLERDNFKVVREKDEILKRFDEWEQYERKVSNDRFVYFAHKSELGVYACAVCKGKEPYPVTLQLISPNNRFHKCHKCETFGEI